MTPVKPCVRLRPRWPEGATAELYTCVRECFVYGDNDDRATGYLFQDGEREWPGPLGNRGPRLTAFVEELTGERFPIVAFQAYRNGLAVADWHTDLSFAVQAILSLGAPRTFAIRSGDAMGKQIMADGDVVYMPEPWEHAILPDPEITKERVSLVFRRGA